VLNSPTTVSASGAKSLTLTGSYAGTNTLNVTIGKTNGLLPIGPVSFIKDGASPLLILTGGNAYTGQTVINTGVIQLPAASPISVIPDRSGVVLADVAGVALDLNGNSETLGSLSGGGATGGNVLMTAGSLTLGLDNATVNFAGNITGGSTGGLTKVGTGVQTLSGTKQLHRTRRHQQPGWPVQWRIDPWHGRFSRFGGDGLQPWLEHVVRRECQHLDRCGHGHPQHLLGVGLGCHSDLHLHRWNAHGPRCHGRFGGGQRPHCP